jgi:2,3-bisphosphoglycerate-independent phosphoglycerate mutase
MGNSEVGHLTIGAGRIVNQELVRISESIRSQEFETLPAWQEFVNKVKAGSGRLHLLGLVSPGGVHSHTDHLIGIVAAAQAAGIDKIFIHAFLDGRDTDPHGGVTYVADLQSELAAMGTSKIATVSGRYYAMDRDRRWPRTEQAWRALVHGEGTLVTDPVNAIQASYDTDVTDEFMVPAVITENGQPMATVNDGDGVFFWNFRADRARQLTWAFKQDGFDGFVQPRRPQVAYLCMTPYDKKLNLPVLYVPEIPRNGLAEIFADHDIKNLRTAETEKYAHVTYFFNGGREEPYPGEERIMIPSPQVTTYDLQPEMSAPGVAQTVLDQVAANRFDAIIVNFANGDMVGHTGVLEAAIKAVGTIDRLLAEIVPAVVAAGGTFLLTADHGNCDEMIDPNGKVLTAHSMNQVPFVAISRQLEGRLDAIKGTEHSLKDLAPTMLKIMGLPIPTEMTGHSLL